jgi:hypothetical protein
MNYKLIVIQFVHRFLCVIFISTDSSFVKLDITKEFHIFAMSVVVNIHVTFLLRIYRYVYGVPLYRILSCLLVTAINPKVRHRFC